MRPQLMEFTAPILYLALNAASLETAFTMSWQSSNTPFTAMLWILSSCKLNICAVWKRLIFSCGDNIKTLTPFLPRIAYSAAGPVSPEVAPRILVVSPFLSSTYSNKLPNNCMAMSLKASVGPLESESRYRSSSNLTVGVMSSAFWSLRVKP